MTWTPTRQDPCTEPCCTGDLQLPAATEEPVSRPPDRICGVTGCPYCPPVTTSGGGDRLPTRTAAT